jgi:hypothetical protein
MYGKVAKPANRPTATHPLLCTVVDLSSFNLVGASIPILRVKKIIFSVGVACAFARVFFGFATHFSVKG